MTDTNAMLMIVGLIVGFGCYFGVMHKKSKAGHEMMHARDPRLYPHNYEQLSHQERKQLYIKHTWEAALDPLGKVLLGFSIIGAIIFLAAFLMSIFASQA